MKRFLPLVALSFFVSSAPAEDPALLEALKDDHAAGTETWIYNDLARGFAEAKRTGKPLFVTFRCVPCKACEGFDAEVAKGFWYVIDPQEDLLFRKDQRGVWRELVRRLGREPTPHQSAL